MNGINIATPKLFQTLRKFGMGGKDIHKYPELIDYPPTWMTSKDHIIVAFRRIN